MRFVNHKNDYACVGEWQNRRTVNPLSIEFTGSSPVARTFVPIVYRLGHYPLKVGKRVRPPLGTL